MKYLSCLDDVPANGVCPVESQAWVEQHVLTLDPVYFPNLSPSEVLVISTAVWVFFATCVAFKMLGRSIKR